MNTFPKPTPNVECPECSARGMVDGSDVYTFSVLATYDSTMTFTCNQCGKPIVVSRDQVAVSRDPLFQIVGMLGISRGMIQPNDNGPYFRVVLKHPDGSETVENSGTLTTQVPDPTTGRLRSLTMKIGEKPEFLLSSGIYRDYVLPEPADKVFTLLLKASVPSELGDKLQLWLRKVQDSSGRCSSVRMAATTDTPDLLPDNRVNVICHLFLVTDASRYATWLMQMCEAVDQTNQGDFGAAILDYARACEIFVGDYLRHTLRQTDSLNEPLMRRIEAAQINERVTDILPLLHIDPAAYKDAEQAWRKKVKKIRDDRVAHVPHNITKRECQEAHDSAYWFIRALQSQCRFEEGGAWDYWARLRRERSTESKEAKTPR